MAPHEDSKPSLKIDTNSKMPPPPITATPVTETPKPILKVNTSRQPSFSSDAPTPLGEKKTIKIKLNSQPSTPAAENGPTKTKAGRSMKPTAKLIESKKRGYDSDEDRPMAASRQDSARPNKMIKIRPSIKTPTTPGAGTPLIRVKPRGEAVEHKPGDAYDSEASDREADPVREQTFVLRVMEDESVDYLRKALEEGTIGQSKQNGGADFGVQFVDSKERRALVTVDGRYYAAVLVNLPTITEAMKTWDRRNLMKNSDVTQMLLCFAQVRNEAEAKTAPLPSLVGNTNMNWPHGLTPPMHDAPNRRFRKAISDKQWERSASILKNLIEADRDAIETTYEVIDNEEDADADGEDEDMDADGETQEEGYFDNLPAEDQDAEGEDDDDIAAMMEAELEDDDAAMDETLVDVATPAVQPIEAPTPATMDGQTPAAPQDEGVSEEEEEDEDVSEEDEDDDDDEELDEEEQAAQNDRKSKLADLHENEKKLRLAEENLENTTMPMLRTRLKGQITNLQKEIAVIRGGLGLTDED